jgi:acid phosphatase (class A)
MWLDPPEDPKIYPEQGQEVPDFDSQFMAGAARFPDRRWGADFQSMTWLIDFTTPTASNPDWKAAVRKTIKPPPEPNTFDMQNGLKELVVLQQTLREKALPEILAQNTEFNLYFCAQLGIYPRSYPKSYLMLKSVARIGELVMVYLKRRYQYVRPSQIYPRLTPPLPVPAHSSYPSGHALISYLMALMATEIVPELGDAAQKLALRIARNREIAGLHYAWDGIGGRDAAIDTFEVIKGLPVYNSPTHGIAAARAEWQDTL